MPLAMPMQPQMLPQGVNPDGSRSLSAPLNIAPPSQSALRSADLQKSMQGFIRDADAVLQETSKTMKELGILAQRMNQMLGGTSTAGGRPGTILPPVSHRELPLGAAASNAYSGASYGTGLGLQVAGGGYAAAVAAPTISTIVPGSGAATKSFSNTPTGSNMPSASPASSPTTITPPNTPPSPPAVQPPSLTPKKLAEYDAAGSLAEGQSRGGSIQGIAQEISGRLNPTGSGYVGPGRRLLFGNNSKGELEDAGDAGIIGRVAGGEDALSSVAGGVLGDGAAGPIGVVAGALDAVYHFGGDWLSSQRAQNATFQSIEGGSNIGALAERGRQAQFEATKFGTFTSKQADQIFQGVTSLGLQGGQRQAGLDFISNNYRELGMSTADSMDLLTQATQTGNASLVALSATLQDVTNTAASAAINTDAARQSFIAQYTSLTNAGISAPVAQTLSHASTNAISKLGKITAPGVKIDFGNSALQAEAASKLNITSAQFAESSSKVQAQGVQDVLNQDVGQIPGISAANAAAIRAYVEQHGIHSVNDSNPWYKNLIRSSHLTPERFAQQLSEYSGVNVTAKAAAGFVAGIESGKLNLVQAVEDAEKNQANSKKDAAAARAAARESAKIKKGEEGFGPVNSFRRVRHDDAHYVDNVDTVLDSGLSHIGSFLTGGSTPTNTSEPKKKTTQRRLVTESSKPQSNKHDGSSQGDGQNRDRNAQQTGGKWTVDLSDRALNWFKITGSEGSTYGGQSQGNPFSRTRVK
jgi:hypothetical protein